MRGRIRNLESMVVNLMNQKSTTEQESGSRQQSGPNPEPALPEQPQRYPVMNMVTAAREETELEDLNGDSFGQLQISNTGTETSYVGVSHWSAILKEISEVKNYLEDSAAEADEPAEETWEESEQRSAIAFGFPRRITKAVLLAEMPPKEEVDRILPLWFNSADPLLFIIHAPTFQEEYKQFWKDPSKTPVMWIALLYGAMALGIILGPRNPGFAAFSGRFDKSGVPYNPVLTPPNSFPSVASLDKYQHLASSAMALADISKPQPHCIEAAMIYSECEFLRRNNHHVKIWLIVGVIVRVALRMGYHRDASHFDRMTAFQGEMRRRAWHVIYQMDTLVSFAIGLPSMIRRIEADTRLPHNLYDHDFSVDSLELPKERPSSEITPGSYTISKSRVCAVFAEAAELSQLVHPPSFSDMMAVDKRLEDAYTMVPEGLRVRSMEDSITDPPILIMSRFNIELLYLKTRIVLHRKYLTVGQIDPRFAESRMACVQAAMQTLRHHSVIFQACLPGGQLHSVWWYMSSLTTYDFLLAAMIVSLELNYIRTAEASPTFKGPPHPFVPEMVELLETTYDIFANHPHRLSESGRAAGILGAILKKHAGPSGSGLQEDIVNRLGQSSPSVNGFIIGNQLPIWGPLDTVVDNAVEMTDPQDIDWTMWDSALQGRTNTLPDQSWTFNPQDNSLSDQPWPIDPNSDTTDLLNFEDDISILHHSYDYLNVVNGQ
ncbi:hypothetical protein K432DRAFT_406853 [Lepidopterella palustris CBS 459.81]|uniref:Xylanolytic transcriptional activator regulatory domain-containing protein n=1 Tax=Lepidopterella palustris CBS 459.81 TaxID=1314670 RepID=A0A8E2JD19_9PEZI|nr:hypothetical protein K432DRAFT_406853 [Lepidopterella palustris CBS 459.81]